MRNHIFIIAACITLLFTGCEALTGKEIGRIAVGGVSTDFDTVMGVATLALHKNDKVTVWSDMDMEYDGDLGMAFRIRLLRDTSIVQEFRVDPREKNVTVGEVKTSFGNHTSWRFTGKNTSITIPEDGNYTVQAILVCSDPAVLTVRKAEVVLKM